MDKEGASKAMVGGPWSDAHPTGGGIGSVQITAPEASETTRLAYVPAFCSLILSGTDLEGWKLNEQMKETHLARCSIPKNLHHTDSTPVFLGLEHLFFLIPLLGVVPCFRMSD